MNDLHTQGHADGQAWSSFALPSELCRLDAALTEHAVIQGGDFVDAVTAGMNPGFGTAFVQIVTGDDDTDVTSYLARRGLKLDAMNQPDYARGFLAGALEGYDSELEEADDGDGLDEPVVVVAS